RIIADSYLPHSSHALSRVVVISGSSIQFSESLPVSGSVAAPSLGTGCLLASASLVNRKLLIFSRGSFSRLFAHSNSAPPFGDAPRKSEDLLQAGFPWCRLSSRSSSPGRRIVCMRRRHASLFFRFLRTAVFGPAGS